MWAWGWEDKLPDDGARRGLVGVARALLGGGEFAPRTPATGDAITIAPSRITPPAALAAICSAGALSTARVTRTASRSPIWSAGFAGDYPARAGLVARPPTSADVARAARLRAPTRAVGRGAVRRRTVASSAASRRQRATATPASSRSTSAAPRPRATRSTRASRLARIGGGALGPALEDQLAPHGLTLRHFPQSFEFSTLGGWLATRAGGHYATLYTHIDEFVPRR